MVLQTKACSLPLQMGPMGTHTSWPTEPLNTILTLSAAAIENNTNEKLLFSQD